MKKIYTVIVTYNGLQWIGACLKSLQQSNEHSEIVIVDNMSTDGTVAFIEQNFPDVTLLRQTANLGFGKGNNIGISYAIQRGADFIFLLNQDATVSKDCLSKMLATSMNNPKYGIISPFHLNWEGEKLEYYFSKFILKNISIYSDYVLGRKIRELYEVPFINAAAWFIPRKIFETVGGFDPIFYHYGEDNNYCQRLNYHGFLIGVVSGAFIYHDSKKRIAPKNYLFTEAYYLNELKQFQIEYANINKDYSRQEIRNGLASIRKLILLHALQWNTKSATGYLKKLRLFKKNINGILQSRKQNVQTNSHYLNF